MTTLAKSVDRHDVLILDVLQNNAAISLRELADKVNLSVAACQRRVAKLKEDGLILKEVAVLHPKLDKNVLTAFVHVELNQQNRALINQFESMVRNEPNVMMAYEVTGSVDYILIIRCESMEQYQAMTRRMFTVDGNVKNFRSHFSMHVIKDEPKLKL